MPATNAMPAERVNLLGMPRSALAEFFVGLGEAPYRATQVMKWMYHRLVDDFGAMTDLSKPLRVRLADVAEIRAPALSGGQEAGDAVVKWQAGVRGGQLVETVLIPEPAAPAAEGDGLRGCGAGGARAAGAGRSAPLPAAPSRRTLCISSQAGCALDCSFCATGKQGFGGNLSRAEIVGQAWRVARQVARRGDARGITNVVFMGMGEPLLNFDAVMDAAEVFMDDLGFGLSKRRVTVSTAGVVPRIYDMTERADLALAVSLHAPRDDLRTALVPINRKYPLAALLAACRHYVGTVGERRAVTFEYTLIEGINDGLTEARELIELLAGLRCKVNLIPFNPFAGDRRGYRRPGSARLRRFQTALQDAGVPSLLRTTRGDEIAAACGQLTGTVRDHTRRRSRLLASASDPSPGLAA